MSTLLACTSAFALALAGFAALSLTIPRHYRQVNEQAIAPSGPQTHCLTALGWTGLAAALAACVAWKEWSVGVTLWLGVLTPAATTVVLLLTYRPRWTVPTGIASASVGIVSGLLFAAN